VNLPEKCQKMLAAQWAGNGGDGMPALVERHSGRSAAPMAPMQPRAMLDDQARFIHGVLNGAMISPSRVTLAILATSSS